MKHSKIQAIIKSSLTNNLKKQIKDLRLEVEDLKKEKMDKRITRLSEVTAELEAMQQEWIRLRNLLEQNIRSRSNKQSANEDIEILRNILREKDEAIKKLKSEISSISLSSKEKEALLEESNKLNNDLKQKMEKLKKQNADLLKIK